MAIPDAAFKAVRFCPRLNAAAMPYTSYAVRLAFLATARLTLLVQYVNVVFVIFPLCTFSVLI